MKHLFLIIAVFLVTAAFGVYYWQPDTASEVPVIYWVTDPNPAREQQVELFHEWLVDHGHTTAEGRPVVELRLDFGNNNQSKKVIQGVSGVGGDIWDVYGGTQLQYFHAIGLLADLTDEARRLGFSTDKTYDAVVPEISVDGRQYAFPCNVSTTMFWVNLDTFRKHGIDPPPMRWTFEDFERIGKQFVAAANPEDGRHTVFFTSAFDTKLMYRTLGLSMFNETLTRCTLDDPRFVRVLRLKRKWTDEDRLIPSAADQAEFATQAGYGGSTLQLFNSGHLAMFPMGRYALIQLRKFGKLNMAVTEPPHDGYPVSSIATRCASIYVGGDHRDKAVLFQSYLASEKYNLQIVRDADALPPNPKYTRQEQFSRPEQYPNEWGLHDAFAETAQTIAISGAHSPFVLSSVALRFVIDAEEAFMADERTAEEAADWVAGRINAEIERTLAEQPKLVEQYERLVERQAEIERRRASGEPVPLDWITNPFYRRYYRDMGWTE